MSKLCPRFWASLIFLGFFGVIPVNANATPAYAEGTQAIKRAAAVNTGHVLNTAKSANVKVAALSVAPKSANAKVSALSNPAGATAVKAPDVTDRSKTSMITAVTDCGDGVQLVRYPHNSGFEINDGGCSLLYDNSTRTMTLIDADGKPQQVTFSN